MAIVSWHRFCDVTSLYVNLSSIGIYYTPAVRRGGLYAIPRSVRLSVPAVGAQLPSAIGTLAACVCWFCEIFSREEKEGKGRGEGRGWDIKGEIASSLFDIWLRA